MMQEMQMQMQMQKMKDRDITLLLVAEPSLQTSMLSSYLSQELKITVQCIHTRPSLEYLPDTLAQAAQAVLWLIDLATIKGKELIEWQAYSQTTNQKHIVALLNAEPHVDIWSMLQWPSCVGVFFSSDLPQCLVCGIKKILLGELWIPRDMLADLYRKQIKNCALASSSNCLLTKRELEILNQLCLGYSNHDIATNFYISENTTKSHLYRIFKKIGVRNRLQAVQWANENLPQRFLCWASSFSILADDLVASMIRLLMFVS
ncbi:CsgBAC operon transcriptional regulatory protein [compost metagenome]